jgi:hypothetical protein
LKEQLQAAYELQEELEARAGNAGKGSDTAVLKVKRVFFLGRFLVSSFFVQLEFEIKQLKKDLEEARQNGGAEAKSEIAKLKEELAKEKARPKGGISKEDYDDLEEENADLKSELQRTKVMVFFVLVWFSYKRKKSKRALDSLAQEVVALKQGGGGGGGGGGGADAKELEELRSVRKEQGRSNGSWLFSFFDWAVAVAKIKQLEREVEDLNKVSEETMKEDDDCFFVFFLKKKKIYLSSGSKRKTARVQSAA